MKDPVYSIAIILIAHYIADYIGQTKPMATLKHQSNKWLLTHVMTYWVILTAVMIFWWLPDLNSNLYWTLLIFTLFNAALHLPTDYFTSKWVHYFDVKAKAARTVEGRDLWEYLYWKMLGLDQLIHMIILVLSYKWLLADSH